MVISPGMAGSIAGGVVFLLVALAEWLHSRRVRNVGYLAFGANGRPRGWTVVVPIGTAVASGLLAFGLVVLLLQEPEAVEKRPSTEGSQHLLVCFDASPSMYVPDSGPGGDKKRAVWAGEVMHAILSRIDTETTRVTVFAVYTDALPVVEDTYDLNVVEHLFDGMPFHTAFEAGSTQLTTGVEKALEYARKWPEGSAMLVVVSDGDSEERGGVKFRPSSIADSIVIGVGSPTTPTLIAGHRSKQEVGSLRALAKSLGGIYHQGNEKQLPSHVLNRLTMVQPRVGDSVGVREVAFTSIGVGGTWIAMSTFLLALFGRRRRQLSVIVERDTASQTEPREEVEVVA